MKLSRLNLNETLGMDKERSHMIERIIHLTLDILYLLTGEDYIVLKMSYGRVTHSNSPCISGGFGRTQPPTAKLPPPPLTPERNNDKKILEVTQKIIELLTGEETRFPSKAIKQEIDDVLRSEEEPGYGNTPERCPRPPERCPHPPERCPHPLYSRHEEERGLKDRKKDVISRDTTTNARLKKKTHAAERTSKVRRGRPRKRRIPETAPSPQPPLGPEDIHVITEDFQSEGEEAVAPEDDLQNNELEEVTKDLHTGRSQDKLPSLPVMEVGEDEDGREENSKHVCRRKRWHRHKGAALSVTTEEEEEEEESGESPGKDSEWEIPADCSLLNISSDGPALSKDNSSEDTILKVSLDEVQEEAELTTVCRNGKKKTFTCLDCGRCFASSEQLESHRKVHTGEVPFSCTACGNSFASSEELGEHLRVHTSEKLFACFQCGKCFTIKANLIAHRRVHTGDKPFACAECGRRFALRSSLETHLPVHAVEKPYPCVLCGKCFTTSGRLAVHQTTHTGDKTYECEDCGKIFTTSSSMNRHRRTHTGEKPYSCMVCGKCFNRETNLYRHQMIHTR